MNETANHTSQVLEAHGPILEAPSLRYAEAIGPCTIYSEFQNLSEFELESSFKKSLETLGGTAPSNKPWESCWDKKINVEASQVFTTWFHQKAREKKILENLSEYTKSTQLKSVEFPNEDYSRYLRTRTFLKGGSRRLLDSLRVARDALDEDPGKEYGQLDLTAIIQMLAAGRKRTDVFLRDEYLSRSYAWALLLDVSASVRVNGDLVRALAICVAEATKELIMDPGSWTLFAFSDRLYVLKDISEAYSHRVRARIGGLKFDGLTYMPDAIRVAGKILSQRFDKQRFLVILSDGWPYGYSNMVDELSEALNSLKKKDIIVIGIGLESDRMENFFDISCPVYSQRDLIKEFAKIYVKASTAALE